MFSKKNYLFLGCIFGLLLFSFINQRRLTKTELIRLITLITGIAIFYFDISKNKQ
jgi:hypothetical protein